MTDQSDWQKSQGVPDSLLQADKAVALHYDGENAPTLSASGENELAQAIIALAMEHEVPVYENAELTEWLSRLELGDEIPQALYIAIAEVLAFVYDLEGKTPA